MDTSGGASALSRRAWLGGNARGQSWSVLRLFLPVRRPQFFSTSSDLSHPASPPSAGVVALQNGTLLMAYRGQDDRGIGMATSPAWSTNFTRLNGGAAVLGPASPLKTAVDEDMTMWRTKRGIQMVLHQVE
jgi:hypothetical protein